MSEVIPMVNTDDRLAEHERRIEERHKAAFIENGLELLDIQSEGDYKQEYGTFKNYVETRWEMSESRAYEIINAASFVSQKLRNCGVKPIRESHVRPLLTSLDDDKDRVDAWVGAVENHAGKTITARDVQESVSRVVAAKSKDWMTIDEWKDAPREILKDSDKQFNKQDNNSIEWAQWSWNPITGCKHDCSYCYARDIANRFYAQGFEPAIYPARFSAPYKTNVPAQAESDTAYKNVFTGSMADIFGRWVPGEWIESVFEVVAENPQWNFLFLTKFPKRMVEFNYPENAWLGTSVDCQARVKAAEEAFAGVTSGTKWLSVEPMLEPLKFERLDLFDWVVIGGASKSSGAPAWVPPMDWLVDLHSQARAAGCKIYYKDNLRLPDELRIKEFPWEDRQERVLPEAFKYLPSIK